MHGNSRRFLAVWLRRLSTDRLRRCGRRSDGPLVVVGADGNARRLVALDDAAARLSLYGGQAFADACAVYPQLDWAEAEPQEDARLLSHVVAWCERYTPLAAPMPPGSFVLDITGAAHLFGGEKALCRDVLTRLAKQGFHARAGLADTAGCAWAIAHYGKKVVVPSGETREALLPLPMAALRIPSETVAGLAQMGLRRIGDIAARPRAPLAARFGEELLRRLDQALGREDEPITPQSPLPCYSMEQDFAEPLVRDEDLLSVLDVLVRRLCKVMEERGKGARRLSAVFFGVDGALRRLELGTSAPLRDPLRLVRLFADKFALAQWPENAFGFDRARLSALEVQDFAHAQGDFETSADERALSHLLDRLSARFGRTRVLSFISQDTHIPEFASIAIPAGDGAEFASAPEAQDTLVPPRPLRLFAKPEPIEAIAEIPDGPPVRFRWRRVLHRVTNAEGPERIAMPWWRDERGRALTRDYFRVECDGGSRLWLYREGLYGEGAPRWFLHGLLP